jgi:hypothetical protein
MMPVPVMTMTIIGENQPASSTMKASLAIALEWIMRPCVGYCNNCTRLSAFIFISSSLLLNSRYCLYWYTTYRAVLG